MNNFVKYRKTQEADSLRRQSIRPGHKSAISTLSFGVAVPPYLPLPHRSDSSLIPPAPSSNAPCVVQ